MYFSFALTSWIRSALHQFLQNVRVSLTKLKIPESYLKSGIKNKSQLSLAQFNSIPTNLNQ